MKSEFDDLIKNKKPKAIERLSKARGMGDLSENSEYTAAKEELAFVDGRVKEIEAIMEQAEVVENHSNGHVVGVGSSIVVEHNGGQDTFQIVGEFEADPMNKKLSQTSPIGQALMNKKVGDLINIEIPAGRVQYKIVDIK